MCPTLAVPAAYAGRGPASIQDPNNWLEYTILNPLLFILDMSHDLVLESSQSGQLLSAVVRQEGQVRDARHGGQCYGVRRR